MSITDKLSAGWMVFCFLLGVPGKVVVVVLRHFEDNFTLHLILNLASSDVLYLISLPICIFLWNSNLDMSRGLWKFLVYLSASSMYTGVLTGTLMSVQRYLMVLHRNQWAMQERRKSFAFLPVVICTPANQPQHCLRYNGGRTHA